MEILFGLGGVVAGIVAASIAWFFIAKNNRKRLMAAFDAVDALPSEVKKALKDLPAEAKAGLKKML